MNKIRKTAENGLVKAGVIGGIGVAALTGCSPSEAPKPEVTTSAAPSPEISAPDLLDALNLPIGIEDLENLSSQEMKELTTISVDSVKVDGEIDWSLVVDRTFENFNIQINAGGNPRELNTVENTGLDFEDYIVGKYAEPLESGYLVAGNSIEGLRATHLNTILAASLDNGRTGEVSVRSIMTLEEIETIDSSESGAMVVMEFRQVDNFFSSGALDRSMVNVIKNLERSKDLDELFKVQISYVVEDGRVLYSGNIRLDQ